MPLNRPDHPLGDTGSHYPILATAVYRTQGPVFEMGAGDFSTPMLHLMCQTEPRLLITAESDKDWFELFRGMYRSNSHEFHLVEPAGESTHGTRIAAWDTFKRIDEINYFGVAFIDGAPGEARVGVAKRLKGKCKYIVVHDFQADDPGWGGNYRWRDLEGIWKYKVIWKAYATTTGIFSDYDEFAL